MQTAYRIKNEEVRVKNSGGKSPEGDFLIFTLLIAHREA